MDLSQQIQFKYRTFRFHQIKTIDQRHQIDCTLKLTSSPSIATPDAIPKCKCHSNESCDSDSWSYWSNCDGDCKQTRIRNKDAPEEQTESRDCQSLCFFDVEDDIDENLKTCSISKRRSKRNASKAIARLMNGSTAYPGSLSYVVRLTFQTFDQYHSDSQAGLSKSQKYMPYAIAYCCISYAILLKKYFLKTNLSNTIFVLAQWLIKIGYWLLQRVASEMIS